MKKNLATVTLLLVLSIAGYCTNSGYIEAMKNNLMAMDNATTIAEKQTVANTFERIAAAEKDKWLPYYYAGMVYSLMSIESEENLKKDQYAEKANKLIESGITLSPDESELYVIQALNYYVMIQVDPMERGMTYMNKANQALETAEKLNPENPRIYFLKGQTLLNLPAEFGGGKDAALPMLKKAKEKYDTYTTPTDIHPRWGKEDVIRILQEQGIE